ncbi:hypothetical protein JCM9279_002473 [Rhodotorula babjevae]
MLVSAFFFVFCTSLALASVTRDGGKLTLSDSQSKKEDVSDISLKEICYRNLYADVDAFTIKHTTEALISDTHGKTVFLSDGRKKAYDDVEYYYEEFCYKKVKARLRSNDVAKHSGLLVGRRLTAPVAQAGLSSSFADNIGGVPHSSADAVLSDRSSGSAGSDDQTQAGGAPPMVLRRLRARQLDSAAVLAGGIGDPSAFEPSSFIASLGGDGNGNSTVASLGAPGPDGAVLAQPLRAPEGSSAPQLEDPAAAGKGKGVERRSPGWIVRVLRIVSLQWDGRDDDEEEGAGEGCEEGGEEHLGVDDGPQGGLLFE